MRGVQWHPIPRQGEGCDGCLPNHTRARAPKLKHAPVGPVLRAQSHQTLPVRAAIKVSYTGSSSRFVCYWFIYLASGFRLDGGIRWPHPARAVCLYHCDRNIFNKNMTIGTFT